MGRIAISYYHVIIIVVMMINDNNNYCVCSITIMLSKYVSKSRLVRNEIITLTV